MTNLGLGMTQPSLDDEMGDNNTSTSDGTLTFTFPEWSGPANFLNDFLQKPSFIEFSPAVIELIEEAPTVPEQLEPLNCHVLTVEDQVCLGEMIEQKDDNSFFKGKLSALLARLADRAKLQRMGDADMLPFESRATTHFIYETDDRTRYWVFVRWLDETKRWYVDVDEYFAEDSVDDGDRVILIAA